MVYSGFLSLTYIIESEMGPGYEHVVGFVLQLTGEIISNPYGKNIAFTAHVQGLA